MHTLICPGEECRGAGHTITLSSGCVLSDDPLLSLEEPSISQEFLFCVFELRYLPVIRTSIFVCFSLYIACLHRFSIFG
jgi:hypothetical protein